MSLIFTQLRWGAVFILTLQFHLFAQDNLQGTIRGRLLSPKNQPLAGVTIKIQNTLRQTISDQEGYYTFLGLKSERYILVATKAGFESVQQIAYVETGQTTSTFFMLSPDAMEMETGIETGTFTNVSKFQSSIGITTLSGNAIQERVPRGTGDLLNAIPGDFVDASAGEVGAQIFPRGLSTGQNNQLGFRYVSLQEEGLPVMS